MNRFFSGIEENRCIFFVVLHEFVKHFQVKSFSQWLYSPAIVRPDSVSGGGSDRAVVDALGDFFCCLLAG